MHVHILVMLRLLNECQSPIRDVCNKTGGQAHYLHGESKKIRASYQKSYLVQKYKALARKDTSFCLSTNSKDGRESKVQTSHMENIVSLLI